MVEGELDLATSNFQLLVLWGHSTNEWILIENPVEISEEAACQCCQAFLFKQVGSYLFL